MFVITYKVAPSYGQGFQAYLIGADFEGLTDRVTWCNREDRALRFHTKETAELALWMIQRRNPRAYIAPVSH